MNFNVGTDHRGLVSDVQNFKIGNDARNWVQARQFEGEMRTVVVNVMEGTIPLNLTGTTIWFEGLMSDGKTRIIDAKHGTILSPSTGQFRFEFPYAAFATFGSYKQSFFKIVRDGKSIATLEFTLDVLVNLVEDGIVPLDYITPFQDLYAKLEAIYQNGDASIQALVVKWQQQITELITGLNGDYAAIQATVNGLHEKLDALDKKIKEDGLLTFDDLKTALDKFDEKFNVISKDINGVNIFYDEIITSALYDEDSSTNYYLTQIPHKDINGSPVLLKHGFANEKFKNGTQTANDFYQNHPTASVVINAAPNNLGGNVIANGNLIQDDKLGIAGQMTLTIDSEGVLNAYDSDILASDLLGKKIVNTWTGFFPIIKNGKDFDLTNLAREDASAFEKLTERHPRQVIAQKIDKTIIILTCEGRLDRNVGMTFSDIKRILYALDINFAYLLDGGGSISTINKGIMINAPIDNYSTEYRQVQDFIYVEKTTEDTVLLPKNIEENVAAQKANVAYNILTKQLLSQDEYLVNFSEKKEIPLLGDWRSALGRTPTYQIINGVLYITGAICHKDSVFATAPWNGINPPVNAPHGIEYPLFSLKSLPELSENHAPLAGLGGNGGDGRPIKIAFEKSNSTCYVYEREDMVGNRYINLDLSFVL